MKRFTVFLTGILLCAALSACAALVPSEYSHVAPYTETQPEPAEINPDMQLASNMSELRQAIAALIDGHIEHGVIRVYSYPGDVEEDLASAAYQAAREDPYGAYAVDYITHSCSLIVSYYEIEVDITFRPDAVARDDLEYAISASAAKRLIEQAVDRSDSRLTLYLTYYTEVDAETIVQVYCDSDPSRLMAVPEVQMAMYPESGQSRILDIRFDYPEDAATLREMAEAVGESLDAASVYVRYRQSEREKAELLFTYLMERFTYTESQSRTPVYALLCEGRATSRSAAVSWQLLCDKAGLECVTVSGMRGGSEYWWNIVQLDGVYCHVDIFRDLLAADVLHCMNDGEMADYYWDVSQYPACPAPAPEEEESAAEEPQPETPADAPSGEPEENPDSQTPQEPQDGGEPDAEPDTPAGHEAASTAR